MGLRSSRTGARGLAGLNKDKAWDSISFEAGVSDGAVFRCEAIFEIKGRD